MEWLDSNVNSLACANRRITSRFCKMLNWKVFYHNQILEFQISWRMCQWQILTMVLFTYCHYDSSHCHHHCHCCHCFYQIISLIVAIATTTKAIVTITTSLSLPSLPPATIAITIAHCHHHTVPPLLESHSHTFSSMSQLLYKTLIS